MKNIMLGLILGIVLVLLVKNSYATVDCTTRPLKQIALSKELSGGGSFIFLIGGINFNENPIYYFFYKRLSGGYQLVKKNINSVEIFEDSKKPYLKYCLSSQLFPSWSGVDNELDKYMNLAIIEIHVPPNSLLNTINLNLNQLK